VTSLTKKEAKQKLNQINRREEIAKGKMRVSKGVKSVLKHGEKTYDTPPPLPR
jgi:hypothetical protein